MTSRRISRTLWALALFALAFFALKSFVADVYPVTTSSMEPTIRPGERVLVRYDNSPPERFDLVVISRGGEAFVKRVVGLGREEVSVVNGDVFINRRPIPPEAPRPAPVPIFDDTRQDVEAYFAMGGTRSNPWKRSGDAWELDARDVEQDESAGLLRYHKGVRDDQLEPSGEVRYRREPVGDVLVECQFLPQEVGGRVRLVLVEQGDMFQFAVELGENGEGRATLSRLGSAEPRTLEELASTTFTYRLASWQRLRFENVDNHLRGELGDPPQVLEASYAQNNLHPRDTLGEGFSLGERVKLGGEGCVARFRGIRIWRDLHFTERGEFGVERSVQLEQDEIFVLGDNSASSRDSREWGPIRMRDVRGRAEWVVWPPGVARRLTGATSRSGAE